MDLTGLDTILKKMKDHSMNNDDYQYRLYLIQGEINTLEECKSLSKEQLDRLKWLYEEKELLILGELYDTL